MQLGALFLMTEESIKLSEWRAVRIICLQSDHMVGVLCRSLRLV